MTVQSILMTANVWFGLAQLRMEKRVYAQYRSRTEPGGWSFAQGARFLLTAPTCSPGSAWRDSDDTVSVETVPVSSKTITINFKAQRGSDVVACDYQLFPAGPQARFYGREALAPIVDLKAYTAEAVFDWIDVRIELKSATQFQFVQRELHSTYGKRLFVNPSIAGKGGASLHFNIRFQDPDRDLVEQSIRDIDERWGVVAPVTIEGIEVSVDFYARSSLDEDRWRMVGFLQRHFMPKREMKQVDDECRRDSKLIERDKIFLEHMNLRLRKKDTEVLRPLGSGALLLDATTYFRPRSASPTWRLMDKISNQRTGAIAEELKQEERRARIEVTIEGRALLEIGVATLSDLVEFKPEQLAAGCFSFWLPTIKDTEGAGPGPTPVSMKRRQDLIEDFARMGVMASLLDDYRSIKVTRDLQRHTGKAPVRLGPAGNLVSWTPLNNVVRLALKRLRF